MRRISLLFCLLLLISPAAAPGQEWPRAPEYDVLLSSYDIAPRIIRLEAGRAVKLRFVNNSNQAHAFSARAFFASADIRGGDGGAVSGGRVKVGPGETRTVALIPQAGRYAMQSDNIFRRLMGMNGKIIVE